MSAKRVLFLMAITMLVLPALASVPVRAQGDSGSYWPTDGWRTSTPEEQGMSSAELAALVNTVATPSMVADSMIVIRHGYIVAEAYFDPVTMDDQHHMWSASKSITSMLIGIAIEKGLIAGVDEKVLDLYADHTAANMDARKKEMTLAHLLTMTSGLQCDGDNALVYSQDDWVQGALDLPMQTEPGSTFFYCNPATTLLSGLINQTAGMSALEFAEENLLAPLGITGAAWSADAHNVNFGASELQLTPRDMAKLGYLYLHQGEWDGQQLVPADWVTASTHTQVKDALAPFDYGYQWWVFAPINAYFAVGHAGQYIWVYPDKDLVFVMTGGITDSIRIAHQAAPLIGSLYMLTTSDESLPADAAGLAELEAAVNAASHPQAQPVPALPELATTISGQTYALMTTGTFFVKPAFPMTLESTMPHDVQGLTLTFDDSAGAVMSLTFVDGTTAEVPIGLDSVYRRSEGDLGIVAAQGAWTDNDTFRVYLKMVRDAIEYRIDVSFAQELVEIISYRIDDGLAAATAGILVPPAE